MAQARIDRMLDDVRITIASYGKIVVLTAAAAIAAVVVAVTNVTSPGLAAGVSPHPVGDFSQHASQATAADGHIPAF